MAPPRQPKFSFRTDSPFDAQQSAFIILKYGELKNVALLVRRAFGTKFYPRHPRMLPHRGQFKRVIDQFLESGSVRPTVPVGIEGRICPEAELGLSGRSHPGSVWNSENRAILIKNQNRPLFGTQKYSRNPKKIDFTLHDNKLVCYSCF